LENEIMLKATVLVLPLFLVGCGDAPAAAGAGSASMLRAKAPSAALAALASSDDSKFTGAVLETIDAGQYTYVRLKTAKGEIWAAVTHQPLKVGSPVTIENAMWMEKFESKTLNRTFDRVLFGSVSGADVAGTALPPGHPPTGAVSPVSAEPNVDVAADAKVERAQGKDARTVAEVFTSKAALKGAEVLVRGRVVKWNAEIMGRNWIHLRDGSGSPEKADNDITITTTDTVARGDVITVRGKVVLDKDFGAGYAYAVIIEDAKVIK
jgi:hypothetical protein